MLVLFAIAVLGSMLLPPTKPEAPADEESELTAEAAPVLIHA
jgi:hypothetical protein